MKFINDSDKRITGVDAEGKPLKKPTPVTVDITRPGLGRVFCKPGDVVEVKDEYSRPGRNTGGGRLASVIECLCPQLRPADPAELAAWEKTPEPVSPVRIPLGSTRIPSVEELVAGGMPPAAARAKVARLMADQSLAEQAAEDGE